MFKYKAAAVAAVAAVGTFGIGASSAMALTAPTAVGDSITGVNTGGKIALGSLISCNSNLSGSITSNAGVGLGGGGKITGPASGAFTSCTLGASATPNFGASGWGLTINGPLVGGNAPASITGVNVNITTFLGTCNYTGSLTGSLNQASGVLTLSGSLTRNSGTCGGGATETVTGKYLLTDVTTSPGQPRLLV